MPPRSKSPAPATGPGRSRHSATVLPPTSHRAGSGARRRVHRIESYLWVRLAVGLAGDPKSAARPLKYAVVLSLPFLNCKKVRRRCPAQNDKPFTRNGALISKAAPYLTVAPLRFSNITA